MSEPRDPHPHPDAAGDPAGGGARLPYLLISLAVLVLDQWSKWMVELHLGMHASKSVIPGFLDITHVQNTGVAFGMFAAHGDAANTWLLIGLGLGALLFVAYYFSQVPGEDRVLLVALALVLGGAVGNLLDRVLQGSVTDFVDVYYGTYHWHTFNVADSAITVGIVLMILGTLGTSSKTAEGTAEETVEGSSEARGTPPAAG